METPEDIPEGVDPPEKIEELKKTLAKLWRLIRAKLLGTLDGKAKEDKDFLDEFFEEE